LAQITYTPNKQTEIYSRFRNEAKQSNQSDNSTVTNFLVLIPKQSWRSQWSYKVDRTVTFRNRFELLWYDKKARPDDPFGRGMNKENGFLVFSMLFINHY
jgi:hypothetical protein